MYFSFVEHLLFQFLIWNLIKCQGQMQTQIRLIKTVDCDMPGLKWITRNISVRYDYPQTFIHGRFDVIENIKKLKKIYLHIERCNEQGYDCEDFQNWRVDRFCQMLVWKDQVWSEFVDKIHPTIRCPVKKMSYELRNATVNLEALMTWFPDITKYRWKTLCKMVDENDIVVYCNTVESYFHKYFRRERRPSKKPRNIQ